MLGWIVDDVTVYSCLSQTQPVLSISDSSAAEGTDMVFTVSLDHASNRTVSVNYRAVSGAATRGLDFNEAEGTLVFPPLTLTRQVTVRIRQDNKPEPAEAFKVVLSHASNAAIGTGEGVGSIPDGSPAVASIP